MYRVCILPDNGLAVGGCLVFRINYNDFKVELTEYGSGSAKIKIELDYASGTLFAAYLYPHYLKSPLK